MNTAELQGVPKDQDDSMLSMWSPLDKRTNPTKSRLDSEKSYADIVNSDHGKSAQVIPDTIVDTDREPGTTSNVTAVMSNMRGRNIVGASREMQVAVNG